MGNTRRKAKRPSVSQRARTSPSAWTIRSSRTNSQAKVRRLRKMLGFTRPTFARLLPISERTLASIEAGKKASPSTIRSLNELQRIIDALSELVDPGSLGDWLLEPNEAFGGRKPLEVIDHGEVDRIWEMIFYLRSGTPG